MSKELENLRRAGMSAEERQAEALERIADALEGIRAQVVNINHNQGHIVRQLGAIAIKR